MKYKKLSLMAATEHSLSTSTAMDIKRFLKRLVNKAKSLHNSLSLKRVPRALRQDFLTSFALSFKSQPTYCFCLR